MFLQNVEKEDIEKFVQKYKIKLTRFIKSKDKIYCEFKSDYQGIQPAFNFTEYVVYACDKEYKYAQENISKDWRKFMLQTFGIQYANEYKEFMDNFIENINKI